MKKILFVLLSIYTTSTFAQEEKVKFAMYDVVFIGGYVDNGAFLNFTGSNINATYKKSKLILGIFHRFDSKKIRERPKTLL